MRWKKVNLRITIFLGSIVIFFYFGCWPVQSQVIDCPHSKEILNGLDLDSTAQSALREDFIFRAKSREKDPAFYQLESFLHDHYEKGEYIKLEISRWPGGGYSSIWFLATVGGALEISTGEEIGKFQQRKIPIQEWENFKKEWARATEGGVGSIFNFRVVDAPVFFVCSEINGQNVGFVIRGMPSQEKPFLLLKKIFDFSEFHSTPTGLFSRVR